MMGEAHDAAVEAMAGIECGDSARRLRPPCDECSDRARSALAALTSSEAVREALVGAAMPAVPREDVAPLLEGNPDLTAYYRSRAEAVADAILAALAPGEAG